jgi:hypothetical protein
MTEAASQFSCSDGIEDVNGRDGCIGFVGVVLDGDPAIVNDGRRRGMERGIGRRGPIGRGPRGETRNGLQRLRGLTGIR